MVKAVFFDIDGTLVPFGKKRIDVSTMHVLKQLRKKDIKVCLATGRPMNQIRNILDQFAFDAYTALNGQYCEAGGHILRNVHMETKSLMRLVPYIQRRRITCVFVEPGYTYINCMSDNYRKILQQFPGEEYPLDCPEERIGCHAVQQIMAYVTPEEEGELLPFLPGYKAVRWNPRCVDIIPEDGGKSIGIDVILKKFGIPLEYAMAFGDGHNDIDMLQYVGVGVAMGNAEAFVRQAADYVTDKTEEGGIPKALKHYGVVL